MIKKQTLVVTVTDVDIFTDVLVSIPLVMDAEKADKL